MLINITSLCNLEFCSFDENALIKISTNNYYELNKSNFIKLSFDKSYLIERIRIIFCDKFDHANFLIVPIDENGNSSYDAITVNSCEKSSFVDLILNLDIRALRICLKEETCVTVKDIEIYTDIKNTFISSDSKILNILEFFNIFISQKSSPNNQHWKLFECRLSINSTFGIEFCPFNDNINWCNCLRYVLNKDYVFNMIVELSKLNLTKDKEYELLLFLNELCNKYSVSLFVNNVVKTFTIVVGDNSSIEDRIELLFRKLWNEVNSILNCIILNTSKKIKQPFVLIDSDLISSSCGFADRFRGILTLIEKCNRMNFDYRIKFTKPFNLNKYYHFLEYPALYDDTKPLVNHNIIFPGNSIAVIDQVLSVVKNLYNNVLISTNAAGSYSKFTYNKNFIQTDYFIGLLNRYKSIIGSEYVTISLRFVNSLGDFEKTPIFKSLNQTDQTTLMKKCKIEINKFANKFLKRNVKVLVLSDSSKFLQFVSDIPNVCVFPDHIAHVAFIGSQTKEQEKCFEKTLVDFNLIIDAQESYRFDTEHLYPSNFPAQAVNCAGRSLIVHKF